MEKNQPEKLKQKYLASIRGPIMFTAPHSKKLYRGGKQLGEQKRIHLREAHTSKLAAQFSIESGEILNSNQLNSFCIWGNSKVVSEEDLDPNYLTKDQYRKSPFHQSLHKFSLQNKDAPLFHIDIHGKYDRKNNCQLDIGLACMEQFWKEEQDLVRALKIFFTKHFNLLFQGMKLGAFQPKCNCQPYLSGLWGGDIATMNQQAIRLGIPSIQLQIPRKMRNLLVKDDKFRQGFLKILIRAYKQIILNWYPSKLAPNIIDEKLATKLKDYKFTKKQTQQLISELSIMQQKAAMNLANLI